MGSIEAYLDNLIAKADKSWEGVDVDSFMQNLRDDSPDKEDAEKELKALENLKKAIQKAMKETMEKKR